MRVVPLHLLCIAASVILSPLANASSSIRNPLSALSTVQNATIHTYNHRVTALSNFDLTFNLRNDLEVKLRLEPNHDILGEDTTVTFLAEDGSVARREKVDRLQHKVYRGTAWVQRARAGNDDWRQVGWARVTLSRDGKNPVFGGAFVVNRDHHHIQTATNYRRTKHRQDPEIEPSNGDDEYMIVWRDSDVLKSEGGGGRHHDLRRGVDVGAATCHADTLTFNSQPDHPVFAAMRKRSEQSYGFMDFSNIFRRQIDGTTSGNGASGNLLASIGQTAGCPTTRKVALMGVAADCNYLSAFNGNESAARENILNVVNSASAVYERTFDISLGLQNLTIMPANCPGTPASVTPWNQACSDSVDIAARLNLFSGWRGAQGDTNAFWSLLSTCTTSTAVGLAWLGQSCVRTSFTTNETITGNGRSSGGAEIVSGANVIIRTEGANEWQVLAHETGHTFGAVHDCTSQTCQDSNFVQSQQCCQFSSSQCDAGGRYIMDPTSSEGIEDFSPCSIGNICSGLGRNAVNGQCLVDNRGVTTIAERQCGNGIVEPGEDCDCGGVDGCKGDSCCDPTTCKFTQGSVCDDANEDCCNNCQFATNGTVCRTSTGQCDPQEVCSGTSASCPADKTEKDGTDCGADGLKCASGQCTSRDNECKVRMGSYTKGNDTYACGNSGCTVSCASPEFGYNTCLGLQQNFLDGIPCGGGGACQNVSFSQHT